MDETLIDQRLMPRLAAIALVALAALCLWSHHAGYEQGKVEGRAEQQENMLERELVRGWVDEAGQSRIQVNSIDHTDESVAVWTLQIRNGDAWHRSIIRVPLMAGKNP